VDGKFKPYEHSVEEPTPGLEAEPIKLRVNLVNDVWVYRGRSTFASVEGALDLELGREVRIEGGLQVPEGRIDVMGRVFEVQPSTVTFSGETPPNPEVVAMASWRSPSGHLITASYRGPAASGKMQLMSEPPLSYGEILNVLLFDDPTGAGDASEGSSSASAVAGTLAGAGLGRTISDLTNLNIQTTVETTGSGASRPEVGIRLSPRFAFQVSYNPQPVISLSEPPDQATVSLDWRISKRWSLDTSLGDQGSASADLAWEFRY
jgi:translocation and assembly module TamB